MSCAPSVVHPTDPLLRRAALSVVWRCALGPRLLPAPYSCLAATPPAGVVICWPHG